MSKSKTTATQNQNINSSTTASNPDWVTNGVQGLLGQTMDLGNTDPQSYVAGPSQLQTQAFNQGSNLTSGADRYGAAVAAAGNTPNVEPGQVRAESLLNNLGAYMSPYTQDVVDTTLADFDQDAGRTRAAQAAQGAAGTQAFGGSRWGVQEGETEGQLSRARASADATLRDSAFNTGAGLSNMDAGRRQEASMFNTNQGMQAGQANQSAGLQRAGLLGTFANGAQSADAQNLGLMSGLGETQRGIATNQAQAPLQLLLAQAGLLGDLPLNLFSGSDTTGTTSGTSSGKTSGLNLGGLLGAGGDLLSGISALRG